MKKANFLSQQNDKHSLIPEVIKKV